MVSHYIGLVGWREFRHLDGSRNIFFIDSILFRVAAYFFGCRATYLPGATFSRSIDVLNDKCLYLVPFELPDIPSVQQYILPFFKEDVHLSDELTKKLATCSSDTIVLIGISTPKQNLLGDMIGNATGFHVHCIGAALLDIGTTRQETMGLFSGWGVEWLVRALREPNRFVAKVGAILRELWILFSDPEVRGEFEIFCQRIRSHIDDTGSPTRTKKG